MDFLTLIVLLGLACSYLTKILLLREKDGHEGPFVLKNVGVYFPDSHHFQKAALFDSIRRLFGVYEVKKIDENRYLWTVKPLRAEVWTCPFCLSLWMSLVLCLLSLTFNTFHPVQWMLLLFATAGISSLVNVKGYE